jgi:hypothetical protein
MAHVMGMKGAAMATEGIQQMEALLHDVVEHLKVLNKPNKRAAVHKLERIAVLAATLAATVQAQR